MDHVGEGESELVFNPTDEEMVHYLLNKVTGKTPFVREVIECDLYGDEELWRKRVEGTQRNCLYFFTKLKKTTRKMSWSSRATAWCNTWKAQSDKKICMGEQVHIGSKRCFSLVEKEKPRVKHGWVMHEYRLDGVYDCYNQGNDYVICRIKRMVSKKVAVKQQEVEGDDAIAIQTNCNEILDPKVTVPKEQETEPPGSSTPQREDDFFGQQEETPPRGVDFAEGGGGNWIQAFAQDLLAYSQNCVEEKDEGVDMLPNHFYEDKWIRGWERASTDHKPNC
ncbi:hypothetical protein CK203_093129 [Vitis vinifera]|uniref:NAC domain-containing protein n=1 Tax=Vitis vinifera TaxID=29760 RepID=A0A438F4R0_VITVI|nr:hypothetical protein CK203_093129 [Vitis vinifera]